MQCSQRFAHMTIWVFNVSWIVASNHLRYTEYWQSLTETETRINKRSFILSLLAASSLRKVCSYVVEFRGLWVWPTRDSSFYLVKCTPGCGISRYNNFNVPICFINWFTILIISTATTDFKVTLVIERPFLHDDCYNSIQTTRNWL